MKKFLIYLVLAVMTLGAVIAQRKPEYSHIKIDKELVSYVRQLELFYRQNDIDIDWDKIKYIKVYNNEQGLLGRWIEGAKTIQINLINSKAREEGRYEAMILLIVAHEIAHSQGVNHTRDPSSIMYVHNGFIFDLLKTKTLGSLVLTPYTLMYKPAMQLM